jgi:hypothetical protein
MHEEIFHNKAYLVNRLLQIDEFKGHINYEVVKCNLGKVGFAAKEEGAV